MLVMLNILIPLVAYYMMSYCALVFLQKPSTF